MRTSRLLLACLACIGLASASLLLSDEPVYDVWAWFQWGRELTHFELDVTTGPSWKPLPVVLAAPLSFAGDTAPQLWLVLVRTAWLASLALAAELAFRLAPGGSRALRVAGAAFAASGVVLLSDEVTHVTRQVAGGMSEPLLVALVLGAARAGLAARPRLALVLLTLAGLLRPEAWPLLAAYGLWCWRSDPRTRPLVVGVALLVPALWLAPELLGAGDGGARRAQTGTSNPAESLGWAALLPLAVAWPLALAALRERAARLLAVGALAWIAVVAAMTVAGFAGLPRFVAPAAAVVCVLGGAGLAALVARPRAALVALVLPALVVTALGIRDRINEVPHAWRSSARIDRSHERLSALLPQVGREAAVRLWSPGDERRARSHRARMAARRAAVGGRVVRRAAAPVRRLRRRPAGVAAAARRDVRRRDARRAARRVAPLLAPLPGDRACRRRAPQREVG